MTFYKSLGVLNEENINAFLASYKDEYLNLDFISAKIIKKIGINLEKGILDLYLQFPYSFNADHEQNLKEDLTNSLKAYFEFATLKVIIHISHLIKSHMVNKNIRPLKNIKNIIAVGSGKGGVGKSTVAVNLALSLVQQGAKVGILDADIYGPSIPKMLGLTKNNQEIVNRNFIPQKSFGLEAISIGFLIEENDALIWRGPMVSSALMQLLNDTKWSDLDYLIVDLPPGTGDIQLTLSQKIPVTASIIVTTPQDVALLDAKKAIKMFQKVHIPILGIIENMSGYHCPNCAHEENIFGNSGASSLAESSLVPLLAKIPLSAVVCEQSDKGYPLVISHEANPISLKYQEAALKMSALLSLQPINFKATFPNIVLES
ncbi:MAG: Iron-sulfur cluster carrier protein [Francisellaceae bacterium]|nr:Iron-sulfur cluster carrier protein [Francisellaceae bacterium]